METSKFNDDSHGNHGSHRNEPLFVDERQRVALNVRDLTVTLRINNKKAKKPETDQQDEKKILNGLSFDLQPGKVLAILGASGSGKTTLLNTLAARMSFNSSSPFRLTGVINYSQKTLSLSYLRQEDTFAAGLTTYETLNYTAHLKLPTYSSNERNDLIEFILSSLQLNKVRDTIIMNFNGRTTLSGGERRRISLALQLLMKPSILFLDEPTTGLDANTSFNLVSTIKALSMKFGITVILTIHQPRAEIIDFFHEICLLAKGGSMLYYGNLNEGVRYFNELHDNDLDGSLANDESNFADFLLKISSVDKFSSPEVEAKTMRRVQKSIEAWKTHQKVDQTADLTINNWNFSNSSVWSAFKSDSSLKTLFSLREIYIIFHRTVKLTLRDLKSVMMLFCINISLAVIVGWMFYKPPGTLAGVRTLTSSLYVCCEILGFTPQLYEIERLCSQDGKFLIKEYTEDKLYSLSSWFIGRRCAKLLLEDIPISLVWSVITFFMWGLNGDSNFGIFFINNLLIYMVGIAAAQALFVIANYQFPLASLLGTIFYQLQNAGCGYFINAKTMPVYVRWTKYIAPFWYSFGSLVSNQFTGFVGDCTGDMCEEYTGIYTLNTLGYPKNWFAVPLVVNVAYFILYYGASAPMIWIRSKLGNVKVAKERKPKAKYTTFSENDLTDQISPIVKKDRVNTEIGISVRGITLSLKPDILKNTIFRRPFQQKVLLNNLNLDFKPGLIAIMGPSGSGKTTLLNLISGRTNSSSSYKQGSIFFNNTSIPFNELSKMTSYVAQDDSCLIPVLTIRETLYFQAKLRLDESRHNDINQIIYQLMKKMGLLEVMNLPVGDYRTKGISGGEKRRLSVAIQLLNENSKVLLLDEPTSGLDSFMSENLIALLKEISEEFGKIIITTIHQPKYEIFEMFDNVVLLKSGNLVYAGDTGSLIENIGFDQEKKETSNINFADYIMDVMNDDEYSSTLDKIKYNSLSSIPTNQTDKSSDIDEISNNPFYQKTNRKLLTILSATFKREFKVILRAEGVLFSRIGQFVGLSVVHALYFSPLRHTSESISDRLGLIQEVLNLYFVGLLNNSALFPGEKAIFFQEYKDNLYSSSIFMLNYFLNEFPMEVISCFVLSVFVVLIIGLPRTAPMFFTMWFMCTMSVNCGESIGIMFYTLVENSGIALNILCNMLAVAIFMGGTMSLNMPVLFRAFNYISPLKYAVLSLAKLGFEGQKFTCTEGSTCTLTSGEAVLDQYGLHSTLWVDFVAVIGITIIYRLVACAIVSWKVRRV